MSVWLQVEAVEVGWLQAEAVEVGWLQAEAVTVKSESAASMAAVCLSGSTVPATVIIVVEYRLVYQLIVDHRQQRPGNRWTSYKGCQGTNNK